VERHRQSGHLARGKKWVLTSPKRQLRSAASGRVKRDPTKANGQPQNPDFHPPPGANADSR
jgi:hypothetical protein